MRNNSAIHKIIYLILLQLFGFGLITAQDESGSKKDAVEYVTEYNILYRDSTKEILTGDMEKYCRLDIYYPKDQQNFATVVWFHGGGLTGGSRFIPEELKRKNIAVIAVEYRLSPMAKCPAYIEDAASATAWVFNNIKKFGGSTDLIYLSGHSAGGYLTLMTGLDKRWLAKYNIDADKIAGLIPFSGQAITHFTIRKERNIPELQPVIDEYAPLYHVRKDAPLLILITGDREMELLGRYEENAYLMRMMKLTGHKKTYLHELDGFDHNTMAAPSFQLLLKYVKERLPELSK